MKQALRYFFDSMADYLAAPSRQPKLHAAHPGWDAPASRVAIYGQFVRLHVRTALEKLYPFTQVAVGAERWEQLVEGYTATRPGRHFEMNQMGEAFPAFVADMAAALELAEFVPALARFEWADWAVYVSEEKVPERVARLTVNPTLTVLQHPFRLCSYVRQKAAAAAPAAGEEMVFLWRHPSQMATWFMSSNERVLLVLKMAMEGLSSSDVAAATGVAEGDIQQAVEQLSSDGLVLAP